VRVALVIQRAKRVRRTILSSVTCLDPIYFSTLSHKWHDFRETFIERKICILILAKTFVRNNFHSKNNPDRHYHNCADPGSRAF